MALSTKQLQKKRAKKQLKRKKNAKELKPSSSSALHTRPIHEVVLTEEIFETGMGVAIVARKDMNGRLVMACFILDTYCLGVKDAYVSTVSHEQYRSYKVQFEDKGQNWETVEPGYLKAVVDGAVTFARQCGFKPRGDFNKAMRHLSMFESPDPLPDFEFGKDGRPFYIAGPHDSPQMVNKVLDTLSTHIGPDGFDYMLPMLDEPDFILDPDTAENT